MLIYVYTVDNQDFQGILKVYYVVKHEHRPLSIKFERFVVIATPFTDRHNITEIWLNAALNTIKQTNKIKITLNGEITLEEITSYNYGGRRKKCWGISRE
jgi:hypothetical protein